MSEFSRYFTLNVNVAMSGIALVTRMGPSIEAWNRRHDRSAGLCVTNKNCDGVPISGHAGYKDGTRWTIDLLMAGPLVNDEKIAEVSAILLDAIMNSVTKSPAHPLAPNS